MTMLLRLHREAGLYCQELDKLRADNSSLKNTVSQLTKEVSNSTGVIMDLHQQIDGNFDKMIL